ncbi:MAG: pilus assembly protein [Chloroflexota bacterium]|nr:pilus assembly protein [Chloroflexota bacterium]
MRRSVRRPRYNRRVVAHRLLAGGMWSSLRRPREGQALLETVLALPVLLVLVFGVVGAGRLTEARMDVSAVAREAARAGALAQSMEEVAVRGERRGYEVAQGYGLDEGSLRLRVTRGGPTPGGYVTAEASYRVSLADLPLLAWGEVELKGSHREPVDQYRSRRAPEDRP